MIITYNITITPSLLIRLAYCSQLSKLWFLQNEVFHFILSTDAVSLQKKRQFCKSRLNHPLLRGQMKQKVVACLIKMGVNFQSRLKFSLKGTTITYLD